MNTLKKLGLSVLMFVAAFMCTSRVAYGAWPDPEGDLGVLRLLSSGTVAWRVEVVSNALQFTDNVTSGLKQFRIFPNNGGVALNSRTNAQLATDTPGAVGALVYNSTTLTLCTSSGTTGGAWVYPSTAAPNVQNPCHS
jgi:hypothetical protein